MLSAHSDIPPPCSVWKRLVHAPFSLGPRVINVYFLRTILQSDYSDRAIWVDIDLFFSQTNNIKEYEQKLMQVNI